jgi:predicted acylesterase/phospholipase RssA
MRIGVKKILKTVAVVLIFLLLIYVGMLINTIIARPEIKSHTYQSRRGTAVVITGAAARIAQEAALLEELHNTGWLQNVCFISGSSSGALNTVMLNAILTKGFSWSRYCSILFKLTNDDIFIRDGRALPVNNLPYRNLLTRVINDSLGYNKLGDLPLHSSVSISDISAMPPHAKTYRLSNIKINEESNPDFDLVEALMATSAIPIIFPAARFKESFGLPETSFVDGGLADDHLPYQAVVQYEKYRDCGVDTLIIVSRKSDTEPGIRNEFLDFGNHDSRISDKIVYRLENLAENSFIKSMKKLQENYPDLATRTFVYIPDFPENFPLLDFNNLKKQYDVAASWASTHKPVKLDLYLAEYARTKKQ